MVSQTELIVEQRTQKIFEFFKQKWQWVSYVLLAFIVGIAVWIRTRNVPGLKDVTTGTWTLGPDLDPFLFLRWAKDIVENGSLFAVDMMRYVPLGYETRFDYPLLPYSMAWFHKIATFFGSVSVEQSAVFYPVFMFAITVISFFFMTRELFLHLVSSEKRATIGALISSFFVSTLPIFLPRTIAGIPEKESAAFFFMFASFYFFIRAWNSEKRYLAWALIAGAFAGMMALVWGGYAYIFLILGVSVLVNFLFGSANTRRFYTYSLFLLITFSVMLIFSDRYDLIYFVKGVDTGLAIFVFVAMSMNLIITKTKIREINFVQRVNKFLPAQITAVVVSILLAFLVSILLFGLDFFIEMFGGIYSSLIKPATSRLIQTVAENRQPYFAEWAGNFGPHFKELPLLFGIFVVGSIVLFASAIKHFPKKAKIAMLMSYCIFLFGVIFTRYSPSSAFTGENTLSVVTYLGAVILFLIVVGKEYYHSFKNNVLTEFKTIRFEVIFTLVFFVLTLVSARGIIRLVLMLAPTAAIIVGYFGANVLRNIKEALDNRHVDVKSVLSAVVIVFIIIAGYWAYSASAAVAQGYVPSSYTQQWQKAMGWVRENTPENAVFGHWWDYGYWIQSIGQRATMLDGGNSIGYWNYLMGRYALTEPNFDKTLEFLYSHNVTHFLIDLTDVGKYSAFSKIGSNASYDRESWIPTFTLDKSQTAERKNSTLTVYPGGSMLDEDVVYELDNHSIFLPKGKAAVAAILVTTGEDNSIQDVSAIFFYQGRQIPPLPLRYYWEKSSGLVDLKNGIDAGIVLYPRVTQNSQGGADIEQRGAILYMSPRTVHSSLARFYLYGEKNEFFKLVHSQDDELVAILRSQGAPIEEFVFFNEFRGPIKIWEVKYPKEMEVNQEFLKTEYPAEILLA